MPELAARPGGQVVAADELDVRAAEDAAKLVGRIGSRLVRGTWVGGDHPQLEPVAGVLDELVAEDLGPFAEHPPHARRVDVLAALQLDEVVHPALEVDQPPRGASAAAGLVLEARDVAEAVVEEHGGAVDEVRDDDLAALSRRHVVPRLVDDPDVTEVLVEVEARPPLAGEPDLEALHRVVGAQDRDSELGLDQRAPGVAHGVAGVRDDGGQVPELAGRRGDPEEELEVAAVAPDHVRTLLVDRLDDRPRRIVDAHQAPARTERAVAGRRVELLDARERPTRRADVERGVLPASEEALLDGPLALAVGDVLEERGAAVVDDERHRGRARRAELDRLPPGPGLCAERLGGRLHGRPVDHREAPQVVRRTEVARVDPLVREQVAVVRHRPRRVTDGAPETGVPRRLHLVAGPVERAPLAVQVGDDRQRPPGPREDSRHARILSDGVADPT